MKEAKKKKSKYRDGLEVIAAFAVAFLFYQALIFATGTRLPIVSVVSDSMYHQQHFDEWWQASGKYYEDRGITKAEFLGFTDFNGLSRGDLLFVVKADSVRVGDIVIYQRDGNPFTIVHRVLEVSGQKVVTKGDNNPVADQPITQGNLEGKVVFAVPALGYPRYLLHMVGI